MELTNYPGRRRRRLLTERSPQSGTVRPRRKRSVRIGSSRRGLPRYAPDFWANGQPRLSELLPHGSLGLSIICAGSLALTVGIPWLCGQARSLVERELIPPASFFTSEARASLIHWLGSVILLITAQVAFAILLLRRERKDDLSGFYRVWAWAGITCVLLSVEWGTGLLRWLEQVVYFLAGQTSVHDFALWWQVPMVLYLAILGSRLFVEYEKCWLAKLALAGAAVCYAGSFVVGRIGSFWGVHESPELGEGLALAAPFCLLLSTLIYARFVIGEITQAAKACQPKRQKRSAAGTIATYIDRPHELAAPHVWSQTVAKSELSTAALSTGVHGAQSAGDVTPAVIQGTCLLPHGGNSSPLRSQGHEVLASPAGTLSSAGQPGGSPPSDSSYVAANTPALTSGSSLPPTSAGPGAGAPPGPSASGQSSPGPSFQPATLPTPTSSSSSAEPVRKLTKAEKKAIRKRLEELRAAREKRLQQSQGASTAAQPAGSQSNLSSG